MLRFGEELADAEDVVVAGAEDFEPALAFEVVAVVAGVGLSLRFNDMCVDEVVQIHTVLHFDLPVDYFAG